MAIIEILTGSASDLDVIKSSGMLKILDEALPDEYGWNVSVCSAHRNAEELAEFVDTHSETRVYIGVAGMAAALPGALAANTLATKPVIGVPLDDHGIDSCVHMPPGVPVLTVGVGVPGLKNAAHAALQILSAGLGDPNVRVFLIDYLMNQVKKKPVQFDIPKEELQ